MCALMRLVGASGVRKKVDCCAIWRTFCQNSIVTSLVGAVAPNLGIVTRLLAPLKFRATGMPATGVCGCGLIVRANVDLTVWLIVSFTLTVIVVEPVAPGMGVMTSEALAPGVPVMASAE